MPRGLHNWDFYAVEKFLKKNGFYLNHAKGSHHFYVGVIGGITRQVLVAFHGSQSIKPKTMKSIIVQSGISTDDWLH